MYYVPFFSLSAFWLQLPSLKSPVFDRGLYCDVLFPFPSLSTLSSCDSHPQFAIFPQNNLLPQQRAHPCCLVCPEALSRGSPASFACSSPSAWKLRCQTCFVALVKNNKACQNLALCVVRLHIVFIKTMIMVLIMMNW